MAVSFFLLLLILIFALFWEDTKVKVLASDSLLSPKGVNYEGEVTVYMSLLLFGFCLLGCLKLWVLSSVEEQLLL